MKSDIAACSHCYRALPWDGTLKNIKCSCGHDIAFDQTARALVHLFFSGAAPRTRDAFGLLNWLAKLGWGDASHIGRHDWVLAGCPVTIAEFSSKIGYGHDMS